MSYEDSISFLKSFQKEQKRITMKKSDLGEKKLNLEALFEYFQYFLPHTQYQYVDMEHLIETQELTENFAERFSKKLSWSSICRHIKLSKNFLKKHRSEIDVFNVVTCQDLEEDTIIELFLPTNSTNWSAILRYQKLSRSFLFRNINALDFKILQLNEKIPKDIIDELALLRKICN